MQSRDDAFRNYGFFLELCGERAGYFAKISNLGMSVAAIEHREGGKCSTVYKLPGRTTVNDVYLEHGVTQSDTLWRWLDSAVQGHIQRRNVSIVLLDTDARSEVLRWNLGNAWVRECTFGDFDALGNSVLIARVCLTAETLERGRSSVAMG